MAASVVVSLRLRVSPCRAFQAFTEDIGQWWRPDPLFMLTPHGDGVLRFEPAEGGRLLTRLPDGDEFEIGRILVWQPGERLTLTWRQATFAPGQATELDVLFESLGGETRITVTHRGWDTIPREHAARHGFDLMLLQRRQVDHLRELLSSLASAAGAAPPAA